MAKGYRQGRLGEEIKKIISEMLLKELKDPRLSAMISITAVEVTRDGSYATVYLSVLGVDPGKETEAGQQEETLAALENAKGFIRNEISRRVKMRHVPELIFKIDRSMEYGRHISKLINELNIDHSDDGENSDDK